MTITDRIPDEQSAARTIASAATWWRQAAVYQIYPRSFADNNGDGVGDFAGVLARIDYLGSLGIDAIWFSPFYPSALADGGYDVDDYRDVDPTIGSIAEFDRMVDALHAIDVKVIIDIVPNHSSDRHVWFRDALAAGPGSRERERYIFRDGRGQAGELPPNDWQAMFGGPAWTRVREADGAPGQWYLHLFTPQQPDWNWDNSEVRDDFIKTLTFWGDHGVDGFRVDVAMGLAKDMSEPYAAWDRVKSGLALLGASDAEPFPDGWNPIFDRDEVHEIYRDWRRVFNAYDPPLFAVGEVWVAAHRRGQYASADELGQAFNFDLLTAKWDREDFESTIRTNLEFAQANDTTSTWVFSNHDVPRHATRLASNSPTGALGRIDRPADEAAAQRGLQRARAATLLAMALPGSIYLYQGEELGLPEVFDIPEDQAQDPSAIIEDGYVVGGRDGCRVPLPWTAEGAHFGFSDGASHLPQPDWFGQYAVDTQSGDELSTLTLYRQALQIRRQLQTDEQVEWYDLGADVLAFSRPNGWTSVTNFGESPVPLPPGTVVIRTDRQPLSEPLAPDATAWITHD